MRSVVWVGVLALLIATTSCSNGTDQEMGKRSESIIRNLPVEDREFLLQPLEAALDDLRQIADNDPGLFASSVLIDSAGMKGELKYRLDGRDTVKIDLRLENAHRRERHWRYWDDAGELFYMESRISYLSDSAKAEDQRAYKLYFEEGQVMISAYGKTAFNGNQLPAEWRTMLPTPEEMEFLMQRTKF